ncbi:metalloregulator ArsR/SmtB family transcription factor [soil metagenome]
MDIFYALVEPNRRRILELLAQNGELTASEISTQFQISAPAISQHLKVLRDANLVHMEKRAQQRIYKFNPTAMHELDNWTHRMSKLWNDRFDRLDEVLARNSS